MWDPTKKHNESTYADTSLHYTCYCLVYYGLMIDWLFRNMYAMPLKETVSRISTDELTFLPSFCPLLLTERERLLNRA
jgi:hypothetical protein